VLALGAEDIWIYTKVWEFLLKILVAMALGIYYFVLENLMMIALTLGAGLAYAGLLVFFFMYLSRSLDKRTEEITKEKIVNDLGYKIEGMFAWGLLAISTLVVGYGAFEYLNLLFHGSVFVYFAIILLIIPFLKNVPGMVFGEFDPRYLAVEHVVVKKYAYRHGGTRDEYASAVRWVGANPYWFEGNPTKLKAEKLAKLIDETAGFASWAAFALCISSDEEFARAIAYNSDPEQLPLRQVVNCYDVANVPGVARMIVRGATATEVGEYIESIEAKALESRVKSKKREAAIEAILILLGLDSKCSSV
jgi:hypothetical protein